MGQTGQVLLCLLSTPISGENGATAQCCFLVLSKPRRKSQGTVCLDLGKKAPPQKDNYEGLVPRRWTQSLNGNWVLKALTLVMDVILGMWDLAGGLDVGPWGLPLKGISSLASSFSLCLCLRARLASCQQLACPSCAFSPGCLA